MPVVNIILEKEEHELLSRSKGKHTWKTALIMGVHKITEEENNQ